MLEQVQKIFKEKYGKEELIDENTKIEDLGLDSLDLAELAFHLEDEFGIEVDDEDMKSFVTIGDVIEYAKKR